jgi:predicted DNA-binding transcriptional regulator AlpA
LSLTGIHLAYTIVKWYCLAMHHLVGLNEIAGMLGLSRARADQLARQVGFPEPEAVLSAGRIWSREAIEEWARDTGRQIVEEG